jgi:hypothetical protein
LVRFHLSTTHLWSEPQVSINGRTFLHRQSEICDRDFARSRDDGEWRSVHVGVLRLDFLDEKTHAALGLRRLSWTPLPGEQNSERIQPGGEVHGSSKHEAGS